MNSPHRRSDAQDDLEGVLHVSMDCGFAGEKESDEEVIPVLVIREKRHKMTWAMLVPRRGTEFAWIARRAAKFLISLGTLRASDEQMRHADCVDKGTRHRFWNLGRTFCICLPNHQEEESGNRESILGYSLEC